MLECNSLNSIAGNGAGKSTLFKMIMNQEKADDGVLRLGDTVVPMYVDQSRDALDPEKMVYQEISDGAEEVDLNGRKVNTRAYCAWYNFKGNDQQKKVRPGDWLVLRRCCIDGCCLQHGRPPLALLSQIQPDAKSLAASLTPDGTR